jgi:hypothetical protein
MVIFNFNSMVALASTALGWARRDKIEIGEVEREMCPWAISIRFW